MKFGLYAVYDSAVQVYQGPFKFQTDGQATRWFHDQCLNAETPIAQHPEDYTFFQVGEWNDSTGQADPVVPICLAKALEVVAASRNVKADNLEEFDKKVSSMN